jgi:hypothetical protein
MLVTVRLVVVQRTSTLPAAGQRTRLATIHRWPVHWSTGTHGGDFATLGTQNPLTMLQFFILCPLNTPVG